MNVVEAVGITHAVTLPGGRRLDILRGADLVVRSGEAVAVVGRSGSGKSTLLAVLGLLTPVQKGRLRIAGRDTAALSDRQRTLWRGRHIGFVFQNYSLIGHLSLYRNVELPMLYGQRTRRRVRRGRVTSVVESVGLQDRMRSRPIQLSGGEQQRTAIARALVHEPSVIMADEPTGSLDVDTANQVLAVLRDACQRRGTALLVVTHDPAVASAMDRTVRLADGVLTEAG